jgi:beta-amylase
MKATHLILGFVFCLVLSAVANAKTFTANVMAPLQIGDLHDPEGEVSRADWSAFRTQLREIKQLGADAVSTDVWWGVIEPQDGQYQWRYYDKLSDEIIAAGLQWIPILSFHQCGGNVGDTCSIPIPAWIWTKYLGSPGVDDADDLKYESEGRNKSVETVSVWATPLIVGEYQEVMVEFQRHFSNKAAHISEVNISLGPAGELRYPSYNSHDSGAGYPTRGRLQAYSALARESFKNFLVRRGKPAMDPPDHGGRDRAEGFFASGEQNSEYGKLFFDWYSDSLLQHGRVILTAAAMVFNSDSSVFRGIAIGAKVPGVHWQMAKDRSAELAAGLIRTSLSDLDDDQKGHGYRSIISLFRELGIVLHFTCLEMDDGAGGAAVGSQAKSLVFWVAQEAARQGVVIKGENALAGAINDDHAWDNMIDAVKWGAYSGLTVLRMGDVLQGEVGRRRFQSLQSF